MTLVIDNYDSFTYNLVQYIGVIDSRLIVKKNNHISIDEIIKINPKRIVISPGPGKPEDAGISIKTIKYFADKIPILGICLGHQAITLAFGGTVGSADEIVHGKTSKIYHTKSKIFNNIPKTFEATRYHSLISINDTFPVKSLKITAKTENNIIMALEHKKFPVFGLQFHPESVVTKFGPQMIRNFLKI